MLKIFIFMSALCSSVMAVAQDIKVISATRQDWSGGIAGHYGTNYTFLVKFSGYKQEPIPDTIWIDNKPIPLRITIQNEKERVEGNTTRTPGKNSVFFKISTGTSHDEYAERIYSQGKRDEIIHHPPVACKGIGLLSYRYQDRQKYYQIKSFTNVLPPINYP